jgi:uncharacterized membrane protein YhaH (DUF805 family)
VKDSSSYDKILEMTRRPTIAFIFSLVAGIIIAIVGFIVMVAGTILTISIGGAGGVPGLYGLVCGVIVIFGGLMLYSRPRRNVVWSSVIIVFSLLSLYGALGGLYIGLILGIIGGILGIRWKPSARQPISTASQASVTRTCPNCGKILSFSEKFCPQCGKELP